MHVCMYARCETYQLVFCELVTTPSTLAIACAALARGTTRVVGVRTFPDSAALSLGASLREFFHVAEAGKIITVVSAATSGKKRHEHI